MSDAQEIPMDDLSQESQPTPTKTKRVAYQVQGKLPLVWLSFQALGITYSDIGTSPLYVLRAIWPKEKPLPPKEDVIGGISAIIWSITLLPLLKYMCIALYFGTKEGEGGSFALFQVLYPSQDRNLSDDRTLTDDDHCGRRPTPRTFREKARWPLLVWCLFGTALTMADGVFTPAVSVTSAIGGIAFAKQSVANDVTPISIIVLLALFVIQPFGTSRLAAAYAPISFVWFLLLIGTGIYNITFFPGIFRAFDPSRAVLLFVRTKDYTLLAGILLALTGCEAMFANLGQFNALSIRLAFCLFVYPALVFAYLGQGARLIIDGRPVLENPFYKTIPGRQGGPLYWIMFTSGTLAALVASQALITATFSLVQQLIHSKALPPVRIVHTSKTIQGQIYIPTSNWILMIATVVVVAAFPNTVTNNNLNNAYGFAVATVMFSTSMLISIHIPFVKNYPVILGVAYFLSFGFLDALFWGAAFIKVPQGAWVPLLMGVIILLIMLLWVWAKSLEDEFDGDNRASLKHSIEQIEGERGEKLPRISTFAIFYKTASGKGVPHTFVGFIRQWPALPRVAVFLSICVVPEPTVPLIQRYYVLKDKNMEGFYGVTYYIGFRDTFDLQSSELVDRICRVERQENPDREGTNNFSEEYIESRLQERFRRIEAASHFTTHIAPRYHVVSKALKLGSISPVVNYIRAFLIEKLYRRLASILPETDNWLTPADELIHVGVNAII